MAAPGSATNPDGDLRIDVITAYNFVVDSNVQTPASYGPEAAYVGAKFCNDGTNDLTDVVAYVGDFGAGSPGVYPVETVDEAANGWSYSGDFSLTHVGDTSDATRFVGLIPAGECVTQYWLVSYPLVDASNNPVFGASNDPNDDLVLEYDIWATAFDDETNPGVVDPGELLAADDSRTATMRSEISAMANKIWPNTTAKVPDEYLDAFEDQLGWRPDQESSAVGQVNVIEGIWYDFGNVNQGFDNDGDLVPDYNAWAQPVGDPNLFDPSCFRLVRSYGILIIKLNDGTTQLRAFEDQLYFEKLPPNNTGVVGLMFYEFAALDSGCSVTLSPYQEVASGSDNEKFNGDFGTFTGNVTSDPPEASITKSAPASVARPGTIQFTLDATNTSVDTPFGAPEYGTPLVIDDTIPTGTTYVGGSAASSNTLPAGVGVTVLYSTDSGATWSTTEPVDPTTVTDLQWWLDAPLQPGDTVTVTFDVDVPATYPDSLVPNAGHIQVGGGSPIDEDTTVTLIQGTLEIGDTVFADDGGATGVFGNGTQEGGEAGIVGATVTLYVDMDGDGTVNSGDLVWGSDTTDASGNYSFTSLPDGDYVVRVDPTQVSEGGVIPNGSGLTTANDQAVALAGSDYLDADFGFAPPLSLDKSVSTPVYEGQEITYPIRVTNHLAGSGGGGVEHIYWSETFAPVGPTGVYRQEIGGTSPTALHTSTVQGGRTAFDPINELVYWGDDNGDIWRKNADGSGAAQLVVTGAGLWSIISTGLEVDPVNGWVFWTDDANNTVWKADISGSLPVAGGTAVITGFDPTKIALDIPGQRIFWVEHTAPNELRVVNYDGTGDTLVSSLPSDWFIDIEFDGTYIYYATGSSGGTEEIGKVDTTGSLPTTGVTIKTGFVAPDLPDSLALDPATGDIYYQMGDFGSGYSIKVFNEATPGTVNTFSAFVAESHDIESDYLYGVSGSGSGGAFDPASTMYDVTLVDTYDPAELEFVSASVTPDSTAPAGTLTWNDVGPIEGGETVTVNVTFKVLYGNAGQSITNQADVTSSSFFDGSPGNTPTDTAVFTLDPSGSISGVVWSEGGTGSGWENAAAGHETEDFRIEGVTVDLFACMDTSVNPNVVLDPAVANHTKACGAGGTNTAWAVLDTTTTDATGAYIFNALLNDGYYYVEIDPTTLPGTVAQTAEANDNQTAGGITCGTCDHIWGDPTADLDTPFFNTLDVSASEDIINVNFGYDVPPALYGNVWDDVDGDGVQESGEGPLAGWTVELQDGVCTPGVDCPTTTTDANGDYEFVNLTASTTYTITVSTPGGQTWTQTFETDGTTDNSTTVTPSTGEISGSWDFAFTQTGSSTIGDTVYFDVGGDGSQDAGDEGIAGVTVYLYEDEDADGAIDVGTDALAATATTAADGTYSFTNLPAGDFIVVVDEGDAALVGATQTGDPDETGDVCATCDGRSGPVTVDGTSSDLDQDFGYQPVGYGAIGDTVFFDANGDGTQNGGEAGIAGISVELWVDFNGDSTFVLADTATTDANGNYLFENLPDGNYEVRVDSADPDLPTDAFGNATVPSTATTVPVTLTGGATDLTADFGFSTPGAIGDTVFADANNNATQDWDEAGIASVTVELWEDPDGDGTYVLRETTTTDASGNYLFTGLEVGDYQVAIDTSTLPYATPVQTADPDRDGVACDDNTYPSLPACDDMESGIAIDYGTNYMGADFGYQPPGVVGDFVWFDFDGDGVQEVGEPGIAGVMLTITGPGGTFNATTDFDGFYSVSDLADGAWTVTVDASNFNPGGALEGLAQTYDATGALDNQSSVTISGGSIHLDQDFGYQLAGAHSLSGTVCLDDPGLDGVCTTPAGEIELEDVFVYLYNSSGDYLGAVETDASGNYSFGNLPDDTYNVVVGTTLPPLDLAVLTTTAADTPATSITDTGTSVYQTVPVSGASVTDVDFAFDLTVDLDFGDLPEDYGTTYGVDGARHIQPTTPDLYLGVQPDFETDGAPTVLATGDGADEDGVTTVSLLSWMEGPSGGQVDIVVNGSGHLVGWIDFNGDGDFFDPGEMIVDQAVTTGTLNHTFDVPLGTFFSSMTDFYARFRLFTEEPLFSELASVGTADNGEVEDYLWVIPRGSIGDTVWLDVDQDGVQDIGEPGISGIPLELWEDTDGSGDLSAGDTLLDTTITDANGNYVFDRLDAGDYFVNVVEAGTVLADLDTSPGTTNPSGLVSLAANEERDDVDFGYMTGSENGAIGDFVWADVNADGIQDPDEVGIGGVNMALVSDPGLDGVYGTSDDVVAQTQMTAADGSYLFSNLLNIEYVVVADVGPDGIPGNGDEILATAGYSPTSGPQSPGGYLSDPIVIHISGTTYVEADFGFDRPDLYSISDTLWQDMDADGVLDAGEEGIAGVTVNLLDTNGDIVATVVSDENGDFNFSGLPNGSYTIQISDLDGTLELWNPTTTPADDGQLAVVVSGADVTGENFGYNPLGTIGDVIWNDADADGVQDPGETGIGGVTVDLVDCGVDGICGGANAADDVVVATDTTAPDGSYLFVGVDDGTYAVVVTDTGSVLAGYTQVADPEANNDGQGSSTIALASSDDTMDFGFQQTALADISGTVFNDVDEDGVEDAAEAGIPGVTVELLDASGNVIATTTTDASGNYTFPDLPDGDYTVRVTDEDHVLDGYTLTSGFDSLDVTVAGVDVPDVDFGYVESQGTGSIGDTVFFDADRDGIQDAGEGGIAGVTVDLYDAGPDGVVGTADDVYFGTETTDANGQYNFSGVPSGFFYVDVTDTNSVLTGLSLTAGTDPTGVILLSEGENYNDADFGYSATTSQIIGDTIFYDTDGDGHEDPGEVGIAGVTVNLIDPGPDGAIGTADDIVLDTAVTDALGHYYFTNVPTGKLYVEVDTTTLPAGYNTAPTDGPARRPYSVVAGVDILYADFGFDGGTTGTIGDTVYFDADGDSTQDAGEPGIEDVTLNLVDTSTGDVIATTTTDVNGNYNFTGVPPGTYDVVVSDIDSALVGLNPTQTPAGSFTVTAAGETHDTADFGYATENGLGSIGNLIWHDLNKDGLFQIGEPLFQGVSVECWHDVDSDGAITPGLDNLIRTRFTDVNGEYYCEGLPSDDYVVRVTDIDEVLSGFVPTILGPNPGQDNNNQLHPYPVSTASSNFTADFGYVAGVPYEITGTTFFDASGDGVYDDPVEPGVDGVYVYLFRDLDGDGILDSNEPQIGSTLVSDGTMDVDGDSLVDPVGYYAFTDMPNGSYIVSVDPSTSFVDGMAQTTQTAAPAAPNQPVSLAGADSNDNDFGFDVGTTAVLISAFEASPAASGIAVRWETASEVGTVGFYLYRWSADLDDYVLVNEDLLPAVPGAPQGAVYELLDRTASYGEALRYALVEIEAGGGEAVYGPFEPRLGAAGGFDGGEPRRQNARMAFGEAGSPAGSGRARARSRRMQRRLSAMSEETVTTGRYKDEGWGTGPERRRGPVATASRLKIEVAEDGLYFVSSARIAAELELSEGLVKGMLKSGRLAMSSGGRPVAWSDAGNGLYFFGEGIQSVFTDTNVYWLEAPGAGERMAAEAGAGRFGEGASSFRESVHFEEDVFSMTVVSTAPVDDFYYWTFVAAQFPAYAVASHSLEVADPVIAGPATLSVAFQGVTSTPAQADHHAVVRLNGVEIGTTSWDGSTPHTALFEVPAGTLAAGSNTLEIEGVLEGDVPYSTFLVDSADLSYERLLRAVGDRLLFETAPDESVKVAGFSTPDLWLFDVTSPRSPIRIDGATVSLGDGWELGFEPVSANGRYLAVASSAVRQPDAITTRPRASLADETEGADYVIVAPQALAAAAQTLADYRSGFGLVTRVVELERLYDDFAYGLRSPLAVREFLRHAYENWDIAPTYAVLAGAGTLDYKDVQGVGGNLVPPLMTATPLGLFASDGAFAKIGGERLPIAIGRIPVLGGSELETYVAKLARYEGAGGDPNVLLLADDADAAGDFPADSDALASTLATGVRTDSIYLSELTVDAARSRLFEGVADGASVVNYLGHGGLDRYGSEGLLLAADADALTGPRLPFFASLTCSVGRFEIPGFESLGEALVLAEEGGAAAVWAPTGQSIHFEAVEMNRALFAALFSGRAETIGQAILQVQSAYGAQAKLPFMLEIYSLLGDPAFSIH